MEVLQGTLSAFVVCLLVLTAQGRYYKRDYDPLHSECGIEPSDRQPCGRRFNKVGEYECLARSCCYTDKTEDGSPGCFLPKRMLAEECDISFKEKDDCGYYGISEKECTDIRKCCYRPSDIPNDATCYHKKSALRLVDGGENYGRVEVKHDEEWGTVCDDMFGKEEADVICRMLGYATGSPKIESKYGSGSGQIWLDSLECKGDESDLKNCPHEGWGSHDCSHSEDAGVVCYKEGEDDDDDDDDYGSGSGYGYEYWDYRSMKKPGK